VKKVGIIDITSRHNVSEVILCLKEDALYSRICYK